MRIIHSEGKQPWQVKEEYRKINRSKEDILIIGDGQETAEVRFMYPDFTLTKYEDKDALFYCQVLNNEKSFKIGSLELDYVREDVNTAWRNCRAIEVALGGWFGRKFNNNIVEVGDVCWQYSVFNGWEVVDPGAVYDKAIRKSIFDVDLSGRNLLSLSTYEHIGESDYNSGKSELHLAIDALKKTAKECPNYLITIPVGANYPLQDYVMNSDIPFRIMRRNSFRGETNNWKEDNNKDNFYLPYFHFNYAAGYFGCCGALIVITNQEEVLNNRGNYHPPLDLLSKIIPEFSLKEIIDAQPFDKINT
jgi:hypothetical protein